MTRPPLVARALDVPGALGDRVCRRANPLGQAAGAASLRDLLSPPAIAAMAASPRANGYLSLEPGLHPFADVSGLLSVALARRHAFAVGGVHLAADRRTNAKTEADATVTLLKAYRHDARAAGYRRALLFPVSDHELPAVAEAGFDALVVGSEAFVDLPSYTLAGKERADLRQMVNRATKRYRLAVSELSPDDAAGVATETVSRWLDARPLHSPMRLLIGSPCFDRPAARRYFACFAPDTKAAVALITITPGWGGRGAGLDVMARAPNAPAGAMELLVHHAITTLAAEGLQLFSLGACPMAIPDVSRSRGLRHRLLLRVFRAIYRSRILNRLFRFRSLVQFKSKFGPTWRPVHIAAWPRVDVRALYAGCRMWGLFGSDPCIPYKAPDDAR